MYRERERERERITLHTYEQYTIRQFEPISVGEA